MPLTYEKSAIVFGEGDVFFSLNCRHRSFVIAMGFPQSFLYLFDRGLSHSTLRFMTNMQQRQRLSSASLDLTLYSFYSLLSFSCLLFLFPFFALLFFFPLVFLHLYFLPFCFLSIFCPTRSLSIFIFLPFFLSFFLSFFLFFVSLFLCFLLSFFVSLFLSFFLLFFVCWLLYLP